MLKSSGGLAGVHARNELNGADYQEMKALEQHYNANMAMNNFQWAFDNDLPPALMGSIGSVKELNKYYGEMVGGDEKSGAFLQALGSILGRVAAPVAGNLTK